MSEPTIQDVLDAIAGLQRETIFEISNLRGAVASLRIELMGRLTGLHDDIAVARQAEALGRQISVMQEQIQRLQSDVRTLKGEA